MTSFVLTDPFPNALRAQNAGRFIVQAGSAGASHPRRTIDSFELIYVSSGTLAMTEAGQRFDMTAGQTLLLWPGREHAGAAPYPPDLSFYWIHFTLSGSEGEPTLTLPQHTTIARPDHLTTLYRRFLDDQETGYLTPEIAAHLIALMLYEVGLPTERTGTEPGLGQAAVLAGQARQYLIKHLARPGLATSTIARALDVHPDHLGRCWRVVTGYPLTEAIHRERLKRAKALLRDTSETVEAVAQSCGFSGAVFFRRLFARHEGMSPTAYRRLYARVHLNSA